MWWRPLRPAPSKGARNRKVLWDGRDGRRLFTTRRSTPRPIPVIGIDDWNHSLRRGESPTDRWLAAPPSGGNPGWSSAEQWCPR
jgi:hypothetical protein